MYCDLWLQYKTVRKLFKGGNYSRAETIRGNTVFLSLTLTQSLTIHNDFHNFPLINLFIQLREDQPPYTISEHHCKLCFSQSILEETCDIQAIARETFFIMVSANEEYSNAILNVTGGNLKSVKEIDNFITEDMINKTLGTFNTRMDLITETHQKAVVLIMDTLNNITTRLNNMQGAYLSVINHFAGAL